MTHVTTRVAGVDVSKAHLDLAFDHEGGVHRLENSRRGIAALLRLVRKAGAGLVVFEATGRYHRLLQLELAAAGIDFACVNPARARNFAKATGRLAKTDRIDALGLAHMGAALQLAPTPIPSPSRQRLKDLVAERAALVEARTADRNRLDTTTDTLCRTLSRRRLDQLERQLKVIEREIDSVLSADPALGAMADRLATIPGVGRLTGAILIAQMPELGTLAGKEAACLAGLAPMANESGARRGRRTIRGGRAALRRALYMPALTAAQHNPALRSLYQRLRAAGKPGKVALTAVMRKLVVIANAMLRKQTDWAQHGA